MLIGLVNCHPIGLITILDTAADGFRVFSVEHIQYLITKISNRRKADKMLQY